MYSLYLIDDSDVILKFLQTVTHKLANEFKIVGTNATMDDSIAPLLELRPDIIIVDHRLPGMDGLEGITLLRHQLPNSVFILRTYLLNMGNDAEIITYAILAGADFVLDYGPITPKQYIQTLHDIVRIFEQRIKRNQSSSS